MKKTITVKNVNELVAIIKYIVKNKRFIIHFDVRIVPDIEKGCDDINNLMCIYLKSDDNEILDCYLYRSTFDQFNNLYSEHFEIDFHKMSYYQIKQCLIENLKCYSSSKFRHCYNICSYVDLYNLCNDQKWFTNGDNSQYEKLFSFNDYDSLNEFSIEQIATIIWVCSDCKQISSYYEILNKLIIQYEKYIEGIAYDLISE